MSAWIVENKSINNIVNSFYWLNDNSYLRRELKDNLKIDFSKSNDKELNKELKMFGQLIVNLNRDSVNQRYLEKVKPFKFIFSEVKPLNIYQFLMSVKCLTYQCCEGNCEERELYKLLQKLEDQLKDSIINNIPEYQNAKWE